MKLALALAALAFVAASPAAAQKNGWDKMGGNRSAIAERGVVTAVVRSQDEWQALWARHSGGKKKDAPAVDFSKEMVVGVFLGERATTGYWVELKTVVMPSDGVDETLVQSGPTLVVFYKEVAPTQERFAAQVVSAPFQLLKVKRYAAVSFEPDTLIRAHAAADTLRAFKDQPRFDR